MTVEEFYQAVGGDYKTALSRMMNDDFIKRMLTKFLANNAFHLIKEGFDQKDAKAMFEGAHAFKGVTANLALDNLNQKTCVIVEAVRHYEDIKEFDLHQEMKDLEDAYLLTKSKLEELL